MRRCLRCKPRVTGRRLCIRYSLHESSKESEQLALVMFRSKGMHLAREVNRAHVSMAMESIVSEAKIRSHR